MTACNSPLNGSLLVYSLGERAETAPAVRLGSQGHLLSVAIHAVELLDWAFLRSVFDPRYGMGGKLLGRVCPARGDHVSRACKIQSLTTVFWSVFVPEHGRGGGTLSGVLWCLGVLVFFFFSGFGYIREVCREGLGFSSC